jgi:proline dehydrogenase
LAGILLRLARQWIAGETAQDGIERTKKANSRGILGLLNLLGEHIENKEQISYTISEYEKLLDLISENKVQSQISIKPTQMGLNIDFDYCVQNYLRMAESCKAHSDNWLWIDMENSPYTQKTIDLYSQVLSSYPNTGIAIQAYMRRSENDLREILPLGAKIRLVKGAYNEHPEVAFKDKNSVRENYSKLLEILFEQEEKNFIAVATHDNSLIEKSKKLSETEKGNFEFEMLMGVRDKLKLELVSEHYQVRE